VNDPFGTGARTASIARATATKAAKKRARNTHYRFEGHKRLRR
jgi:hypothetical protein